MSADIFNFLCITILMFGGLLTATEPLSELKARKNGQQRARTTPGRSPRKNKLVKRSTAKAKPAKAAPVLSDESMSILRGYLFGRDFPQYKTT